jgi:hypothetical protein
MPLLGEGGRREESADWRGADSALEYRVAFLLHMICHCISVIGPTIQDVRKTAKCSGVGLKTSCIF